MKRTKLPFAAFCGLLLLLDSNALAQKTNPSTAETSSPQAATSEINSKKTEEVSAAGHCDVESLTRRIEKLESQNRLLAEALSVVQAKMAAVNQQPAPVVLPAAATVVAQSSTTAAIPSTPTARPDEDRNPP